MQARISQKVAVSVVFVAAMFISIMDVTIVNVALPTIGREFSVSPTAVDSISIAFLVSLAVFIPASGWLGDRFGGKRVLLTAIAVFTIASALCGQASSLGELVAFRVLQGAGGGMLAPVGMAMLFRVFPPEERIRASAILTAPTTLAPALGPVLGGLLVTGLSWRWVFYVNVPIGAAAIAFGAVFLRQVTESRPGRFDLPGFLLSGLGLGQRDGQAPARLDADPGMGVGEPGPVGRDQEVAGESELEPAGHRGAIDRPDERSGEVWQDVLARANSKPAPRLREFVQVKPGAEGRIGAGQHDRPDV